MNAERIELERKYRAAVSTLDDQRNAARFDRSLAEVRRLDGLRFAAEARAAGMPNATPYELRAAREAAGLAVD